MTNGKTDFTPYIVRLVIVSIISLLFVILFNEGTYFIQREEYDRTPKVIQLVIPAGTAARVSAGEPVPSIPEDMVFVVGDTLEVKNEDTQIHQLGPLTVPPGATASLVMEKANKYAYSCSFQPSRYLGLDVRQATTFMTRLTALLIATPTTAAFLFIYSLAAFPVRSKERPQPGNKISRQA